MNTKANSFGILALGAVFTLASSAQAGEILRLKSVGAVKLEDRSAEIARRQSQSLDGHARHFVIQFSSAIAESDKAALRAQGIEVSRYLPDDALLARGTDKAMTVAKLASDRIRAIAPFEAEWKLSPEFAAAPSAGAAPEQILVSTLEGTSVSAAAREIGRIPGAQVISTSERDLMVSAKASSLAALSRVEGVEWIQRAPIIVDFVYPGEPDAPGFHASALALTGYESGTKVMGFDAAWERGYRGQGQTAAVADTGLDSGDVSTAHADFKGTLVKGYNMGLGTRTWADVQGHGTHVSGSVVGTGALSERGLRGGAHEGKLLFEGLWSALLDNLAPGTDFKKLMGTVYADGARVHSNSWGAARGFGDYDTMASRVDEYMWNNPDMLVLFAAGNSGQDVNRDGRVDENSIGPPATAKNILSVGASENLLAQGGIQKTHKEMNGGKDKWGAEPLASDTLSNDPNGIAAFSSRGPTNDGRIKPEIVAPGTNIVSTRSRDPKASALWGAYNADYAYAGGTSMATPLTAGAATVVRQFLVEGRGIANPSAALVKATLMHTATDLFPGQYGTGAGQELQTRRPNVHEGYGRVNMDAATALGDETQIIDDREGVALGGEKSIEVTVRNKGFIRATLTYTDAPAAAGASRALVNDLDLIVMASSAPNYVAAKYDRVNNTEMLELNDLGAATFRVTVKGENVPQGKNGKQPYALVVTTGSHE